MENQYELTIVLPASGNGKEAEALVKAIEERVTSNKGKIVSHESWGKKRLAYPINKETEGIYEHFVLELKPEVQTKIDSILKVEESLLRYLFVRA